MHEMAEGGDFHGLLADVGARAPDGGGLQVECWELLGGTYSEESFDGFEGSDQHSLAKS